MPYRSVFIYTEYEISLYKNAYHPGSLDASISNDSGFSLYNTQIGSSMRDLDEELSGDDNIGENDNTEERLNEQEGQEESTGLPIDPAIRTVNVTINRLTRPVEAPTVGEALIAYFKGSKMRINRMTCEKLRKVCEGGLLGRDRWSSG